MSQRPEYICDGCQKPIGNKAHLTLFFNPSQACGVALPPKSVNNDQGTWKVVRHIQHPDNFKHFHNGKCIGIWGDAMIAKAVTKKKA